MIGTPFPVSLAGRACEECKMECSLGSFPSDSPPTHADLQCSRPQAGTCLPQFSRKACLVGPERPSLKNPIPHMRVATASSQSREDRKGGLAPSPLPDLCPHSYTHQGSSPFAQPDKALDEVGWTGWRCLDS